MQVSVEASSGLERTLKVAVPAQEIEQQVASRLSEVARTAKIKGFRPGKIPRKVVEKRYGGQVRQEVLSEVLQRSYAQAIQQENLNPAGGPRIQTEQASPGKDFEFTAIFEVFPEIRLEKVEGLAVERPEVAITDADVDDMLERLRAQRASWEPAERASAEGDQVTVDFVGRIEGEPFKGGEGRQIPVVLGEGSMLEDFEQGLYGRTAGEEATVPVTFPEDYRNEELAGKQAEFTVTVTAVAERRMPEIDEEFARQFGIEDGSLEALRSEVRENMQRELDERVRQKLKTQVLDELVKHNPVELPRALIDQEIAALQQETMRRMGVDDPAKAPPAETFRAGAVRRVHVGLLINELITAQNIQLDRSRVDAHIEDLAANYDQPEEIIKVYQSQPRLRNQVEMVVLEEQVTDWLVKRGAVTVTDAEFKAFMEA
ncbi:MAG: trigger factor [Gammaproteobacteria bacterium]|nr:trigger factor [Gammaproteobacteria bacterium]